MSKRITVRDQFRTVVEAMTDFGSSNVALYKLDKIDKTPFASITLGAMTTDEEATMGRRNADAVSVSRSLSIFVDFHQDTSGGDADAQLDGWLTELETALYQAMKDGGFAGKADFLEMARAEFHPLERDKETKGDLTTEWRVEFSESITLT